jgi:hypothetical protein
MAALLSVQGVVRCRLRVPEQRGAACAAPKAVRAPRRPQNLTQGAAAACFAWRHLPGDLERARPRRARRRLRPDIAWRGVARRRRRPRAAAVAR